MDPRHLELAAEFCTIAGAPNLLAYLKLAPGAATEEVIEAFKAERRRMQGMQANPKYQHQARFLIKHRAALEEVLTAPQPHLDDMRRRAEAESLPTLTMAIDGILADGVVTPNEEQYVRELAVSLGVPTEQLDRILDERARALGVTLSADAPAPPRIVSEAEDLARSEARGWWDVAFTARLLDEIPQAPGFVVDVYCRKATAALAVLPHRTELSYLGFDKNPDRLLLARRSIQSLGGRARLQEGEPWPLPLADESADIVLMIRALQNLPDTRPALTEAARVLKPGGRLIVVEPDGLAEQFYFEGHLTAYNHAFHALSASVDDAKRGPGGIGAPGLALGPLLARRLAAVGLSVRSVGAHAASSLRVQARGELSRRLRGYATALAASTGLDHGAELNGVVRAVDQFEAAGPADERGLGGNMLPLFLAVGVKT